MSEKKKRGCRCACGHPIRFSGGRWQHALRFSGRLDGLMSEESMRTYQAEHPRRVQFEVYADKCWQCDCGQAKGRWER